MARLIDIETLEKLLHAVIAYQYGKVTDVTKAEHRALCWIEEKLKEQPTIDAVPVRHGKWIPYEDEEGEHYGDKCSVCGEWYVMPYGKTNFCPNCGAKMDEGEEE